jgi:hypothetical protein
MMAEFHPTSKIAATISGYDSIVDCAEWNSAYGYVPKYLFKREDK